MTISNQDDIIDSRDIIDRIEELEALCLPFLNTETDDKEIEEAEKELDLLKDLQEQAERYCPDWEYGVTLVRATYFTKYGMDLLKDCGIIPNNIPHYVVIDEEATTNNLLVDYTKINFNGVTYYCR